MPSLQRVPARELIAKQSLSAAPGNMLPMAGITQWLDLNGFNRAATVREAGDYAVRGGIVDLFAPGMDEPVRLDFFGDTLESIRSFDPETQRTNAELRALDLVPMAEFQLTSDTIRRSAPAMSRPSAPPAPDDVLYEAVSEGRRYAGMEHWLPLFHQQHGDAVRLCRRQRPIAHRAAGRGGRATSGWRRSPTIIRRARKRSINPARGAPYKPLPPDRLYLAEAEWRARLDKSALARLTPFAAPGHAAADVIEIGAHAGHNFTAERATPGANVFEAVTKHVASAASRRQARR